MSVGATQVVIVLVAVLVVLVAIRAADVALGANATAVASVAGDGTTSVCPITRATVSSGSVATKSNRRLGRFDRPFPDSRVDRSDETNAIASRSFETNAIASLLRLVFPIVLT